MQPGLSDEQEFFRETTSRFLDDLAPPSELRRLRDHAAGFEADYWRRGAELGWTSLLVSEDHGGGSISGEGLSDLTLVAHEFGRHAAPGPLLPTNVVAGALSAADSQPELLAGLLDGSAIATWCLAEGAPGDGLDDCALEIRPDGDEVVLNGTKRPIESAAQASHLLVTGRSAEGLSQVVVPAESAGISMTPMEGVDLTRRFWSVTFDDVRVPADAVLGEVGGADDDVGRQLQHAIVILNAETVGALDAAFDMTLEWAFDRYTFGRPLASYQALKHRIADMKTWLEAGHAISDEAARAVGEGSLDAAELTSAAAAFLGEYGLELLHECVQLHGGIGLTFEHDLHFFLRRATANRALFGTPSDHRRRLADLIAREAVPA